MVHHLTRHPADDLFVVALSALLVVGFAVWVGKERGPPGRPCPEIRLPE